MFEKTVADLITKYGSQYIKDLDASSLNIGVFSGDVRLRDLELRQDALDSLNLPVDVQRGWISTLSLKVPWRQLSSKPVVVEIDELYMLIEPKNYRGQYNAKEWDAQIEAYKKTAIANFEANRKAELEARELAAKGSSKKQSGFIMSLTESILNNLHIVVNSIHVRVEVEKNVPKPFVIGLTWNEMSIHSTDDKWNKTFVTKSDIMHKLLDLKDFSIYMDTEDFEDDVKSQKTQSGHEWAQYMYNTIQTKHRHILEPLQLQIKLDLLSLALTDPSRPRYNASINMDGFGIELSNQQFMCWLHMAQFLTDFTKLARYCKFRPAKGMTPKSNPRAFWKFAINAVMSQVHEKRMRNSKYYWKLREKLREEYIELHKRSLGVPFLKPLTKPELARFERMNNAINAQNIIQWRTLSYAEVDLLQARHKAMESSGSQSQKSSTWTGWLWGGSKEPAKPAEEQAFEILELTDKDREEVYKSIGYNPGQPDVEADDEKLDKSYISGVVGFKLGHLTFRLRDFRDRLITEVRTAGAQADTSIRNQGMVFKMSVQDLTIMDELNIDSNFRQICRVTRDWSTGKERVPVHLLKVKFESRPLDGHADSVLKIAMKAMDIAVNPKWLQALVGFFVIPPSINLSSLEAMAAESLTSIQQASSEGLKMALEQKATFDMILDIAAPTLFVPNCCTAASALVLKADLGKLFLKTDVDAERKARILDDKDAAKHEDFYDKMEIALRDVKLAFLKYEKGQQVGPESLMIEPFKMNVNLWMSLCPESEDIPKLILKGNIEPMKARVSPQQYEWLMVIVDVVLKWLADMHGNEDKDLLATCPIELLEPTMISVDDENDNVEQAMVWTPYTAEARMDKLVLKADRTKQTKTPTTLIKLNHESKMLYNANCAAEELEMAHRGLDEATKSDPNWLCVLLPQGGTSEAPEKYLRFIIKGPAAVLEEFQAQANEALVELMDQERERQEALMRTMVGDKLAKREVSDANEASTTHLSTKQVTVQIDFHLDFVGLYLGSLDSNLEFQTLLEMSLSNMGFTMKARNFDTEIEFKMKDISAQFTSSDTTRKFLTVYQDNQAPQSKSILEQDPDTNLTVKMEMRKEGSPLHDPDEDISMILLCSFSGLNLEVERTDIPKFIAYLFVFQSKQEQLSVVLEQQMVYSAQTVEGQPVIESTQRTGLTKIGFHMRGGLINFANCKELSFAAGLKNTQIDLTMGSDKLKIEGLLDDIVVENCGQDSGEWKRILGPETRERCITFSYEIDNSLESDDVSAIYNQVVKASLNKLRIVYLNRFITKLTMYFDYQYFMKDITAQQKEVINAAVEASSQVAYEYAKYAAEKAAEVSQKLLQFDITLEHPHIVVPTKHDRKDHMKLNLGLITLKNELVPFCPIDRNLKGMLEEITIAMQDMNIIIRSDKISSRANILYDSTITLKAVRPIDDPMKAHPGMNLETCIEEMKIVLTKQQYVAIMDILNSNVLDPFKDKALEVYANAEAAANKPAAIEEKQKEKEDKKEDKKEEKQVAAPAPQTVQQVFVAALLFKQLLISLEDDEGEKAENPQPITSFTMDVLQIDFQMLAGDEGMKLKIDLDTLLITDDRPSSNYVIREMLRYNGTMVDNKLWMMSMHQKGATTEMELNLGDATVTLLVGVLKEIVSFVTIPQGAGDADPNDGDELDLSASTSPIKERGRERANAEKHHTVITADHELKDFIRVTPRRQLFIRDATVVLGSRDSMRGSVNFGKRPLAIEPPKTCITIDGKGHSIRIIKKCHRNVEREEMPSVDRAIPGIIIQAGVHVVFKDVKFVIPEGELEDWIVIGKGGSMELDSTCKVKVRSTKNTTKANQEQLQVANTVAPLMIIKLAFLGTNKGPTLLLPVDASKEESVLVVAQIQMSFEMELGGQSQKQEITFKVDNFMVFNSRVGAPTHKFQGLAIVGPTSVLMESNSGVGIFQSGGRVNRYLGVTMFFCPIRVSYKDIDAVLRIVNSLATITAVDAADDAMKKMEAEAAKNMRAVEQDKTVQQPDSQVRFSTTCHGIEVLIVDDSRGFDTNLLRVTLEKFKTVAGYQTVGATGENSGSGQVMLSTHIDFYNINNSSWEPVVEKRAVDINLQQFPKEPFSIALKARESLNVTISAAMMDTIMKTSSIWVEGLNNLGQEIQDVAGSLIQSYPIKIVNDLGLLIKVKLESASVKDADMFSLKAGEDKQLHANMASLTAVGVNFGEEFYRGIDITKTITSEIIVDIDGVEEDIIKANLQVIDSQKVLTLSSRFQFINHFGHLDLRVAVRSQDHTCSIVIPAKNTATPKSLPLQSITEGAKFTVCPEGVELEHDYQPSIPFELTQIPQSEQLTITCEGPKGAHFYGMMEIQVINKSENSRPDITIHIRPPFSFMNLLPVPCTICLYYKKPKCVDTYFGADTIDLQLGEQSALHAVDPSRDVYMTCQLHGDAGEKLHPSGQLCIHGPNGYKTDREDRITCKEIDRHGLGHNSLGLVVVNTVSNLENTGREIRVYCRYWIINKTCWTNGRLGLKADGRAIAGYCGASKEPIMFQQTEFDPFNSGLAVRIDGSDFSQSIPVDTVGQRGQIKLPSKDKKVTYNIGVSIDLLPGEFRRVKVVRLTPLFQVVNETEDVLLIQQLDYQGVDLCKISPQESFNIDFWRRSDVCEDHKADPQLQLKLLEGPYSYRWSAPFAITNAGRVDVVLRALDQPNLVKLISVNILQKDSITYIQLAAPQRQPAVIVNNSFQDVVVRQKGLPLWEPVGSFRAIPFYWTDHTEGNQKMEIALNTTKEKVVEVEPRKLGTGTRLSLRNVVLDVECDLGHDALAVIISDPDYTIWHEGSRRSEKGQASKRFSGSEASIKDDEPLPMMFTFQSGLGISLVGAINERLQELAYIYLNNINLEATYSAESWACCLSIEALQIANQLSNPIFPVLISIDPTYTEVVGNNTTVEKRDAITFSIASDSSRTQIWRFDTVNFLIQTIVVTLDDTWLIYMYDWLLCLMPAEVRNIHEEIAYITVYDKADFVDNSKLMYFELIALQPMAIDLTFLAEQSYTGSINPLIVMLNTVGMAVTNIEAAPLRFGCLILNNVCGTTSEVGMQVGAYYMRQAIIEVFKVLGSLQFLGNPVALVNNLGEGVFDLFWEPAKGLTQSPGALFGGIAKGTTSLFKHSIYGMSNTASGVAGSLGKGLATLTFDEEYIKARRKAQRERREGVTDGVVTGAQQLASGVVGGVTGVFTKPIEGAKKKGVGGFFTGIGQGLAGAILKPMAGALDLVDSTTKGLMSASGDGLTRVRVRLPRAIIDGILRSYEPSVAAAAVLLHSVHDRSYENDTFRYVIGAQLPVIIVLSDKRILGIRAKHRTNPKKNGSQVWMSTYGEIASVRQSSQTLVLSHRDEELYDRTIQCASVFEAQEVLQLIVSQDKKITAYQWDFTEGKTEGAVQTYQNQRFFYGLGWGKKLLPSDPEEWSDAEGKGFCPKEAYRLPPGCLWLADWELESLIPTEDPEKWAYSTMFGAEFCDEESPTNSVRRRRWVRRYKVNEAVAFAAMAAADEQITLTGFVWENQRKGMLTWDTNNLGERHKFSDKTGIVARNQPNKKTPPPPGARWISEWEVEKKSDCDKQGWQYSLLWTGPWGPDMINERGVFRRRKWARQYEEDEADEAKSN